MQKLHSRHNLKECQIKKMYKKLGQFIDGTWQQSSDKGTYDVINPATEEVLGKASKATSTDVERALKSAEIGLEVWKFGKILRLGKELIPSEKLQI